MKKIIKKWGESLVLSFSLEEQRVYGIEEGDVVDLSDITIEKQKSEVYSNEAQ